MTDFKKFIIVCGLYGCGKTNFAVNLAMDIAGRGERVAIVDLDIVNPYFRTSDFRAILEAKGIKVVTTLYAGSNVDIPAIPAEIYSVFNFDGYVIFDVGGSDAGAIALGTYSKRISALDYEFIYVVNRYRSLYGDTDETIATMYDIELASRLKVTTLVNNSHLKQLTDGDILKKGYDFARECSKKTGLPLKCTLVSEEMADSSALPDIYPVKIYVKTPWE